MRVISRADARTQGLKRYFTGKPCLRGHVAERMASTTACLSCKTIYEATHAARHPGWVNQKARAWRATCSDLLAARKRAKYAQNAEPYKAASRRWDQKNPDKVRVIQRVKSAKYRAAEISATPSWLTEEHYAVIRQLHAEAAGLSDSLGIDCHVDHIVPLRGKTVCGLHVPWNLRIITAQQNRSKANKLLL